MSNDKEYKEQLNKIDDSIESVEKALDSLNQMLSKSTKAIEELINIEDKVKQNTEVKSKDDAKG